MPRLEPLGGLSAAAANSRYDEVDLDVDALPRDHPKWVRDAAGISQRARAIIARLAPVRLRVLGFWDHQVRAISIGAASLSVDASGSYRLR